jgi:hypothetical protein
MVRAPPPNVRKESGSDASAVGPQGNLHVFPGNQPFPTIRMKKTTMFMFRSPENRSAPYPADCTTGPPRGATTPGSHPPLPTMERPSGADLIRLTEALATWEELWDRILVRSDRRWSTRLAGGDGWEAWLRTWPPSSESGWHDHGSSSTAFTVLQGELLVRTCSGQELSQASSAVSVRPGTTRLLKIATSHELVNPGIDHSTSLHVYSPVPSAQDRHGRFRRPRGRTNGRSEHFGRDGSVSPGYEPAGHEPAGQGSAVVAERRTRQTARPRSGPRSRIS